MMKSEFVDLLIDLHEGESVLPNISEDDYRIIEAVYTYYPDFGTKGDAAVLYDTFGIKIFKDMYRRVTRICSCEEKVKKLREELAEAEKELEEARS